MADHKEPNWLEKIVQQMQHREDSDDAADIVDKFMTGGLKVGADKQLDLKRSKTMANKGTDIEALNYTTVSNDELEDKIGGDAEKIVGEKGNYTKGLASTLQGINEGMISQALTRDKEESLASIKARAADTSTIKGDAKLLKNFSTDRVVTSNVAFTEARAGEFRQRAMMESILENEIAGQLINLLLIDETTW